MKIGDLVMLSAYGNARGYNSRLSNLGFALVGIVVEHKVNSAYPYRVRWVRDPRSEAPSLVGHSRRELRYAYR